MSRKAFGAINLSSLKNHAGKLEMNLPAHSPTEDFVTKTKKRPGQVIKGPASRGRGSYSKEQEESKSSVLTIRPATMDLLS